MILTVLAASASASPWRKPSPRQPRPLVLQLRSPNGA